MIVPLGVAQYILNQQFSLLKLHYFESDQFLHSTKHKQDYQHVQIKMGPHYFSTVMKGENVGNKMLAIFLIRKCFEIKTIQTFCHLVKSELFTNDQILTRPNCICRHTIIQTRK